MPLKIQFGLIFITVIISLKFLCSASYYSVSNYFLRDSRNWMSKLSSFEFNNLSSIPSKFVPKLKKEYPSLSDESAKNLAYEIFLQVVMFKYRFTLYHSLSPPDYHYTVINMLKAPQFFTLADDEIYEILKNSVIHLLPYSMTLFHAKGLCSSAMLPDVDVAIYERLFSEFDKEIRRAMVFELDCLTNLNKETHKVIGETSLTALTAACMDDAPIEEIMNGTMRVVYLRMFRNCPRSAALQHAFFEYLSKS